VSLILHFVPRPRRPMEALDLGLGLLQVHKAPVYGVFFLQMAILLALILPFTWRQPVWALLWLWWLTPWLNRGTLHVLSRRVFGQEAGVFTFLSQWRAVHRRGLAASLLWRRLSAARSFLLPVWQLEDQGAGAYGSRSRLLLRQGGGTAFLLGVLSLLLAALTLFGILGLLQMLVPRGLSLDLWGALGKGFDRPWFAWTFTAFGVLALALTEPFYAAAGFALYLNRRTELEGWDLEQAFRNLAARLRSSGRVLLLFLALGAGLWAQETPLAAAPPSPAQAEPKESKPLRPDDPARKVVEELEAQDPDLRQTRDQRVLRYRPTGHEPRWLRALLDALFGERKPSEPRPMNLNLNWWKPLALILKIVLVASLVGLLLYILVRFHALRLGGGKAVEDYEAPGAVAGLDIRPESLPPDIPGEALIRFRMGDPRGALALLYRGALAVLVHGHRLEIPASATEGDCLRAAIPTLEESPAASFRRLTNTWIRMAYLGEIPPETLLLELCADWRMAFGGGR